MNYTASDFNISIPRSTLNEAPSLSLDFYSYGVMFRKREGDAITEYPVDPAQVAAALAAKITFDTGLLSRDTLLVRSEGVTTTVIEYRHGQLTGIFLDGADSALRVPLPPLIMLRVSGSARPTYAVYAVKRRPRSLDAPLFHAPLPNVYASGSICWGSVRRASPDADASLAADWGQLLGSPFGDHACRGKSRSHPQDIRQMLIALEANNKRRYPTSDLMPAKKTLAQALISPR